MSQEVHKHYHINLLPQDPIVWLFIALAAMVVGGAWSMSREAASKAEAEKAKYEAQGRAQIVREKS